MSAARADGRKRQPRKVVALCDWCGEQNTVAWYTTIGSGVACHRCIEEVRRKLTLLTSYHGRTSPHYETVRVAMRPFMLPKNQYTANAQIVRGAFALG